MVRTDYAFYIYSILPLCMYMHGLAVCMRDKLNALIIAWAFTEQAKQKKKEGEVPIYMVVAIRFGVVRFALLM